MAEVIGSAVIQVTADARQLKAGIEDARKSIRTLGEGQKDISKSAQQSIDKYIGRLQAQNDTLGKSTRETEIYKLALRGASNEQINAANAALKLGDSHRSNAALLSAINAGMIAAAAAATAFAGSMIAMVVNAINAADHLHDLNKTTGISVENLSGLALAAKQSGGDLDGIAASINKLSQNIGKDGDKFRALGITARDPLEAFKQLADIFVAIDDPQTRAAVGAAALGKSWASAAPLLAEGGKSIGEMVEKGKKFSGMTGEMADGSDKLKDKLDELEARSKGFGNKLATEMVPGLNKIVEAMATAYDESGKLSAIWAGMKTGAVFLATDAFSSAKVQIKNLNEELKDLEETAAWRERHGVISGVIGSILGADTVLEDQIAKKKAQIEFLQRSLVPEAPKAKAPTDPKVAARAAAFIHSDKSAATAEAQTKLYTSALQKLELELGRVSEMTVAQQIAYETTAGSLKALTGAEKANLVAKAVEVDKRREFLAVNKADIESYEAMFKVREQLGTIAAAANDASRDYLDDLKFEASLIGKTADEQARMNEERKIDLDLRARLKTISEVVGGNPADIARAQAAAERAAAGMKAAVPGKLSTDATKQNIADVDKIRESLKSVAQVEEEANLDRLVTLITWRDKKVENEVEANRLIEAEAKQHADKMLAIKQAGEQQQLSIMQSSTDQLYGLMKQAGLDQTALGKAAFIASKGIAIAQILQSTEVAAAQALATGPYVGIVLSGVVRAMGYASAGLVAGMAIKEVAGGRAAGGPVGAGSLHQVNERGPELLTTGGKQYLMMGAQGGNVTPNSGFGGNAMPTIINATTGRVDRASYVPMPNGERAILLEEAVAATAAQLADPNSKVSRSMSRNYNAQRSRG